MRLAIVSATLLAAVSLQGCSKQAKQEEAAKAGAAAPASEKNLVDAVGKQADLTTVAAALKSTGLTGVFSNAGSYTLLAPTNAAFAKLGDKAGALTRPDERAALTAVLRDHLVPGYLTRDDIAKAIAANGGKAVRMRSLGNGELSFTKTGEAITVSSPDGTSGALTSNAVLAGPSIALPVDTVLKKL